MLIVESDRTAVEQSLFAGELRCPNCRGELRPWSSARMRAVREHGRETVLTPRRSGGRSASSRQSWHVVAPAWLQLTLAAREPRSRNLGTTPVQPNPGLALVVVARLRVRQKGDVR